MHSSQFVMLSSQVLLIWCSRQVTLLPELLINIVVFVYRNLIRFIDHQVLSDNWVLTVKITVHSSINSFITQISRLGAIVCLSDSLQVAASSTASSLPGHWRHHSWSHILEYALDRCNHYITQWIITVDWHTYLAFSIPKGNSSTILQLLSE